MLVVLQHPELSVGRAGDDGHIKEALEVRPSCTDPAKAPYLPYLSIALRPSKAYIHVPTDLGGTA